MVKQNLPTMLQYNALQIGILKCALLHTVLAGLQQLRGYVESLNP